MQQIASNALTSFLCTREAVAAMRRRMADALAGPFGQWERPHRPVTARPPLEFRLGASMAAFAASKAAVAAMTGALGDELAAERHLGQRCRPAHHRHVRQPARDVDAAYGQWPTIDAVARAIVQLASPLNGGIRGAVVPLYGRS